MKLVHLLGDFTFFISKSKNAFTGPIKKGFRPVVWQEGYSIYSSSSFVSDKIIHQGDTVEVEIVILDSTLLGDPLKQGIVLSIGSTQNKIGEFVVREILGQWQGKVP